MHKEIYDIGKKLPKGDKLGIHTTVEKYTLELLATAIAASLTSGREKIPLLKKARIQVHQVIHLIRTEYELGIVMEKIYLRLSAQLVEIAKMLNGWITYETNKESR
ncbi:MAG: four helix bundle protein [bacterium]|nr:four helix bundle protein [bacterium]